MRAHGRNWAHSCKAWQLHASACVPVTGVRSHRLARMPCDCCTCLPACTCQPSKEDCMPKIARTCVASASCSSLQPPAARLSRSSSVSWAAGQQQRAASLQRSCVCMPRWAKTCEISAIAAPSLGMGAGACSAATAGAAAAAAHRDGHDPSQLHRSLVHGRRQHGYSLRSVFKHIKKAQCRSS